MKKELFIKKQKFFFDFEFISLVSDKFSYSVNRLLITFKTTIKKSLQAKILWNKMITFYVITTNNCAVKLELNQLKLLNSLFCFSYHDLDVN